MIVVATAVVTVVVSAVVTTEQSMARVFRSALNYTFNRAAGGSSQVERERLERENERTDSGGASERPRRRRRRPKSARAADEAEDGMW